MRHSIIEKLKVVTSLINTNTDPQSKFDVFYKTIDYIQNTCQPTKTVKTRNDKECMTPRETLTLDSPKLEQ